MKRSERHLQLLLPAIALTAAGCGRPKPTGPKHPTVSQPTPAPARVRPGRPVPPPRKKAVKAPLSRAVPVAAEPDGEPAEKLRQAFESGKLSTAAAIAEAQLGKQLSARMYWWLGRVRWKQGRKPAARRAWARARAVLEKSGADLRVMPMPPDSFRALAWHGRKRLVILRWRKHPEKIVGVQPWVELWHSAGIEP